MATEIKEETVSQQKWIMVYLNGEVFCSAPLKSYFVSAIIKDLNDLMWRLKVEEAKALAGSLKDGEE
jgi:hypothetical protein